MDLQKEREVFEKLPAVAELIKTNNVWWSDVHGDYFGSDHELDCWIDGAWAVWQAKAQAVPEGFVVVPKEPTQELLNKMQDFFVGAFENGLTGGQSIHCAYIAMIEARESANESE